MDYLNILFVPHYYSFIFKLFCFGIKGIVYIDDVFPLDQRGESHSKQPKFYGWVKIF